MNPTPESNNAPASGPGGIWPNDPGEGHPPEALTTVDAAGNRMWVYPAGVRGRFMRWRRWLGYFVIAVFFVMPWIEIGGMQSILIEIPERRFVLFGHIFWPQDMWYLVFLLLGLALALFFFTALAGRVWCGWLCPQTVFMEEVFRRIEEWVEGDHRARQRLDRAPWSLNKAARKGVKHALFLGFSALVSNTFLAYFVGTERLLGWMVGSPAEHWTAFLFMAAILGVFYFDFAWFREQFCIVLCPYARFQSVLTDEHTVQVGYDVVRGEPRGRLGSTTGDCIDCHRCVAVCPTAIDIRDGYQLECIGCARCIDACDEIMERVHRPHGLIRLDSLARLHGQPTRILRPRVVVYSVVLIGVVAALFVGLGMRPALNLAVVRPPGEPFTRLPGDMVANHFSVRLHNRSLESKRYTLAVEGADQARLIVPVNPMELPAGKQMLVQAFVKLPEAAVPDGKLPLRIQVFDGYALAAEQATTFLAPIHHEMHNGAGRHEAEEHEDDDDAESDDDR